MRGRERTEGGQKLSSELVHRTYGSGFEGHRLTLACQAGTPTTLGDGVVDVA